MKKVLFYLSCLMLGGMVACNSIQMRTDPSPSPVDPLVSQTRLEFAGCGKASQVGTIVCLPGQTVSIQTEFAGDVIYFSSGANCSIRQQIRAQTPRTAIPLPAVTSICPVTVYYLPEYLPQGQPTMKIYGILGEVSLQPDPKYEAGDSFALAVNDILHLQFAGAQRGYYIGRQVPLTEFQGDSFDFKPIRVGTDLIQVKLFYPDGTIKFKVLSGNYFSETAIDLVFDMSKTSKKLHLQFPQTVSVVTINGGKPSSNLSIDLPLTFSGYVRAYTVKGRTVVAYFEQGELVWKQ